MPDQTFPHLNLILKFQGAAKLEGGGAANKLVAQNKKDRPAHKKYLESGFKKLQQYSDQVTDFRDKNNLPAIKANVPFVLRIPNDDVNAIDYIAEHLGLEIVAEYEDGYLIVSSEDLHQSHIFETIEAFANNKRGAGQVASILEIDEDPLSDKRLKRILDDAITWPLDEKKHYILDVSIEAQAFGFPKKPRISSRTKAQTKEEKLRDFSQKQAAFFAAWEQKRIEREGEIEAFVNHYNGAILSITDDSHIVEYPDSFSMRIKMSGVGFTDFIKNYASLFEVALPDDIQQPPHPSPAAEAGEGDFRLNSPVSSAPTVCIIDSGMQENHRWLQNAIETSASRCFIPGKDPDDVADEVSDGGHGTGVAGASLYPQVVPKSGETTAPFWLINARALDEENQLRTSIFPAALITAVVSHYKTLRGTRIYNHSIGGSLACPKTRMTTWATAIDLISYNEDVLFVQAAGNIRDSNENASRPGILQHLGQQRPYPNFLYEGSTRICNPAQSLQALTVGSISGAYFHDTDRRSVSPALNPSAFSRTGFGLWDCIKPEVVEFGGDFVTDSGTPPSLTTPSEVCPELIRSTLNGGPPFARDRVGTSFAAPKVTHIAGVLQSVLPERETLLYRALIVNSARWPSWAEGLPPHDRQNCVRSIGYGIPSIDRATGNSASRVTLITDAIHTIKAKEGIIFGVPIPSELRRPGSNYKVRVDVTLSYAAEPRRTRKSRRGYLNVWLDWKSSKRNEAFDAFKSRALKDFEAPDSDDDGNFPWTIGNKMTRDGESDGVCRKNGTVQKDWTIANSYELPDVFGVVVRGHEGWAHLDKDAKAKFSLVVSFEAIGADVEIYSLVKQAVTVGVQHEVQQRV